MFVKIRKLRCRFLTQGSKGESKAISHYSNDDANPGHLQTGGPPRTDRDQRFQRAHSKVRRQTDDERSGDRSHATGEKERNNWNKSADRGRDGSRGRSSPLIRKPMLGQAELALGHRLHELFGLFSKALRHFLRFFRSESLQLIEERHLLDFFFRILFDLLALARDLTFVHFLFAFLT